MNELSNYANSATASTPSQQKIIPGKLSQIHSQNEELNGTISKDIHQIIDRVRNIGLRLNPDSHPDNIPQPELKSGSENGKSVWPPDIGGLTADINKAIDGTAEFIDNWHNNTYRSISKYLSYIEEHI